MNTVVAAQAPRTLIADDQPDVLAALRLLLKGAGYHLLRKLKTQIDYGRSLRDREAATQRHERQLKLELDEAREIQRELMPRKMPHLHGFSIASAWQPARGVSGDYLAAFKVDDSRAALCDHR